MEHLMNCAKVPVYQRLPVRTHCCTGLHQPLEGLDIHEEERFPSEGTEQLVWLAACLIPEAI